MARLCVVETCSRSDPAERSPWLGQLPPVVVAEVQRRRAGILAAARGRLLDLDTPGALDVVRAAAMDAVGDLPAAERFDTIVSTTRLIDVADLPAAATGLHRLLAPDGELHLVEPVNRPGILGLLASSVGALLPAVTGLHLARDVVRSLRVSGLVVVDLDRFTMTTAVWPLRRFVQGRAVPSESFGRSAASHDTVRASS
jgi:hypothetical protein